MTGELPVVFYDNRNNLDPNFSRILNSLNIPNPIYFITGNDLLSSKDFINPIKVIHLSKLKGYAEASVDFSNRYRHYSTNNLQFELACFLRFFAFELLLTQLECDRGWLMDSDVWPKIDIRHFEETSSDWFSPDYWDYETISPHSSLMNLALVREFNRFLTNSFYQGHGEELERKFIQIRQEFGGGGICDMTALGIFLRRYWERPWCDSNTIKAGEFYLSHAISKVQTDLGISEKQLILIIQRKKYFHIFSLGKTRKYATLHFQGNDKYLIPYLAKFKFIFGNKGIFQYLVRAARKHQSISTRK